MKLMPACCTTDMTAYYSGGSDKACLARILSGLSCFTEGSGAAFLWDGGKLTGDVVHCSASLF
jgi:hypothetical protein